MSIFIGKHIQKILGEAVADKVGNRIYPVIIPGGVHSFPFIIHQMQDMQATETKDVDIESNVKVVITVVSKNYEELLHTAHTVDKVLRASVASYSEFEVIECERLSLSEDYIPEMDANAIDLTYNFKTVDNG